jgi:hypothetical protein
VKFVSSTKENLVFSPMVVAKPHVSTLRKKWLEYTSKGEYEQLQLELESYQQKGGNIRAFFDKEGEVILNWALIGEPSIKALKFIIQHISKESIQIKLEQDNYSLLRVFLLGRSCQEQHQQCDSEYFKKFCDKIKLLLILKPEGIKNFLKESIENLSLGPKVQESIKKAISSFEKEYIEIKHDIFDKPNFK